jgi:hypothetical protein
VKHASFAEDSFTFHVRPGFALPELEQPITLFRGDERIFTGIVTGRPVRYAKGGAGGTTITVSGPVRWLGKNQATAATADDQGVVMDRAWVKFDTADLAASVGSLLGMAVNAGAPLRTGTIDPSFLVAPMTFSNVSWLSALSDACLWTPDAASRVRYNVTGLPVLDILRRAVAANWQTLTVGKDDITGIDLNPQPDLLPTQIVVNAATVAADGKLAWWQSTAGPPGSARRQIVTVSGPEKAAWVPGFQPDSVSIRTLPIGDASAKAALINSLDERLKAWNSAWSYAWDMQVANATFNIYHPGGSIYTTFVPVSAYREKDTEIVEGDLPGYAIVEGTLPDWWSETGIPTRRVKMTKRMLVVVANGAYYEQHADALAISDFCVSMPADTGYYAICTVEFDAIDAAYPDLTEILRPRDIAFVSPPGDLADNLLQAQAWMPYAGSVTLGPGMPWRLWTGSPLCILGVPGSPELAHAGALVQEQTFDLRTGEMTLSCGSPPRSAFGSLLTRFRSSHQDNFQAAS